MTAADHSADDHRLNRATLRCGTLADAFAAAQPTDARQQDRRALGAIARDLSPRHRVVIAGILGHATQAQIGLALGIKQPAVSVARRRAIAAARYMLDRPGARAWPDDRVRRHLAGQVDADLLDHAVLFAAGGTCGPLARRLDVTPRKWRDIMRGFETDLRTLAAPAAAILADRLVYRREHPPIYAGSGWSRARLQSSAATKVFTFAG